MGNNRYAGMPNGYEESIERGIRAAQQLGGKTSHGKGSQEEQVARLSRALQEADAIVIGGGAGLSTSAGFAYSGPRFEKYFPDFIKAFGIRDMYSGGFYPYPSKEVFWGFWARSIYINRYVDPPKPVYDRLFDLVRGRDYFAVTTNVDHCFQKAGFDKKRLFYTQGDYGLFQSSDPKPGLSDKTYDNEGWVMAAMEAQGFVRDADGVFQVPADPAALSMAVPADMVPKCPDDGCDMTTNLRVDGSFVEDEGWHRASAAYSDFLRRHEGLPTVFLELGVGGNTPVIIKYPFWQMTGDNPNALYACVNYSEAFCPREIEGRSVCIDGDIGDLLDKLLA